MALGPFYVAQKLKQTNGPHGTAILMRHGETEWNKQGRVMGRIRSNSPNTAALRSPPPRASPRASSPI